MNEYHVCKGCKESFSDNLKALNHRCDSFPKNYQGVVLTSYARNPKEAKKQ